MNQTKNKSQFTEFTPIEFLDGIHNDKHIIMFDENPTYSKKIQFHFLNNGLEKGEHAIYAMPEDKDVIEKEMKGYGIDVEKYKKENLLDVYHTTKINQFPQGDSFDNLLKRIMPSDPTEICRIVGMLNFDTSTQEGMDAFLKSEKESHSIFENFSGSWMCSYPTTNIEPENRLNWIRKLIKSHDSVIFTSSHNEGIAFDVLH